ANRSPFRASRFLLPDRPQPLRRINRRPPSPDLKVQVRAQRRIAHANGADRLTLDHARAFANIDPIERSVDRVVATAVLETDGVSVRPHRTGVGDRSAGY